MDDYRDDVLFINSMDHKSKPYVKSPIRPTHSHPPLPGIRRTRRNQRILRIVWSYPSILLAHSHPAWNSTNLKKSKNSNNSTNSSFPSPCSLTVCLEFNENEETEEFEEFYELIFPSPCSLMNDDSTLYVCTYSPHLPPNTPHFKKSNSSNPTPIKIILPNTHTHIYTHTQIH